MVELLHGADGALDLCFRAIALPKKPLIVCLVCEVISRKITLPNTGCPTVSRGMSLMVELSSGMIRSMMQTQGIVRLEYRIGSFWMVS